MDDHSEYLKYQIADLNLSKRTFNALNENGICTIEKLLELSDDELVHLRGLGAKARDEITDAVSDLLSGSSKQLELHEWMLENFNDRTRALVISNFGLESGVPIKATVLARNLNISRSRVGQILERSCDKLTGAIKTRRINPDIYERLNSYASCATRLPDIAGLSTVYNNGGVAIMYAKLFGTLEIYSDSRLKSEWLILSSLASEFKQSIDDAMEWLRCQPGFVNLKQFINESHIDERILRDLSSARIEDGNIALFNGFRKDGIDAAGIVREVLLKNVAPMKINEISEATGLSINQLRGLLYRVPTVVNVGPSTFALTDYGYSNRNNREIILDYLEECGRPMQLEDIIKYVLHYRSVDAKSVQTAVIVNPQDFTRLSDGYVALAKWGYASEATPHITYDVQVRDAIMEVLKNFDHPLSVRELTDAIIDQFGDQTTNSETSVGITAKSLSDEGFLDRLGTRTAYYYQIKR